MFAKLLFPVLLGYLAFCLILFVTQRSLLYFPDTTGLSPEQARARGLSHWPAVDQFLGYMGEPVPGEPLATVIVFHGNGGAAHHRGFYRAALGRQRLRVILAEYPGYGGRPGSPSEQVLVHDALSTISLAYERFGGPIILWGESLGCGVAAAALRRTETPVQGLVLFLPWDSLPEVAQNHYWYVPARWLVRDRYDNIDNLRHYSGPVAVVLAGEDEVIPVRHGQRLYAALTSPKQQWLFAGASHNAMPLAPELAWWGEVIGFLGVATAGANEKAGP